MSKKIKAILKKEHPFYKDAKEMLKLMSKTFDAMEQGEDLSNFGWEIKFNGCKGKSKTIRLGWFPMGFDLVEEFLEELKDAEEY